MIIIQHNYYYIIDGSLFLNVAARIENGNFTFINGETNTSVWPGYLCNYTRNKLMFLLQSQYY